MRPAMTGNHHPTMGGKHNPTIDKNEINRIVYEMYQLTDQEINIVERINK